MKNKFSTKWNSSVKPRKQRKFRFNAPLHVKVKFLSANLSKELRQKHSTRSLKIRKGDEVKVVRGQFKGKVGKVDKVDVKESKVYVVGVEYAKRDGNKAQYPMQPSNLQIVKIDLSDKLRKESLERKSSKTPDTQKKKSEKPEKKAPKAEKSEKVTKKPSQDKKEKK